MVAVKRRTLFLVPDAKDQRRTVVAREVALQRKFGGKRRRGRMPRQIAPKPIAVEYAKSLRALVRAVRDAYQPILDAMQGKPSERRDARDFSTKLKREATRRANQGVEFAPTVRLQGRQAKRLLDDAEKKLNNVVSSTQVETLASKFAARTSSYQRIQLGRQVRAALGADPFMRDEGLGEVAEDFVSQNVSLITRIPKRLHEKVEGMVMNAVAKPDLNVNLAEEIEKQFGIAERHAMLIARDQIAKFYGNVNRKRQENLGVRKFVWRTVNDERVRDSHGELEGQEFSWDDLPLNERGEPISPGSDFQCRCYSEPVLTDLVDDVDDAEEELEPDYETPDFEVSLDPADYEE